MFRILRKTITLWVLMTLFSTSVICASNPKKGKLQDQNEKPKNIILLIGDGMGISQVSSIYFDSTYSPNFNRFKTIGLIKTSSASELITDSAAAATAFASGEKSYNGAIGVDINKQPIETIIEWASEREMKTGLVSTSSITHATPASFYAHVESRSMQYDIASFLPKSGVDFFAGGGRNYFFSRKDDTDLVKEFTEAGYVIDTAFNSTINLKQNFKYGFLLADDGMKAIIDGRTDFLPECTKVAVDYLAKANKGFYLMVEGSQIDWGGHGNNGEFIKGEMLDFDKAIGAALDFAKNDGNTLVIVTADHETGGYTLAPNGSNYNEIQPAFATTGHSATLIPVFAYGPGEEAFSGIFENTEIFHKIKTLLEK